MACSDIVTFLINGENFYLFNSLFSYDKVTSSWKSTKLMKFDELEVKLILELSEESSYYNNYNSSRDYKLKVSFLNLIFQYVVPLEQIINLADQESIFNHIYNDMVVALQVKCTKSFYNSIENRYDKEEFILESLSELLNVSNVGELRDLIYTNISPSGEVMNWRK